MDPRSTADPASSSTSTHSTTTTSPTPTPSPSSLRKRVLSIDTSSRDSRGSPGRERESKARQEEEEEESVMASAAASEAERERDVEAAVPVPMSPAGRLFRETNFNCYIVAVIGLGARVDVAAARAGLEATLVRHPRFCSVQVSDEASKRAKPRWVRTTVNLDDHLIFPELDPTATSASPDQVIEDYMSTLSTQPMDHSRPLWELHVLDFPTSEAAATVAVRMHHSLGDGISLLSLLIACTRSAADPARLPALPPAPARRDGPVYARRRPPLSAGIVALAAWAWSYLVLALHTLVDVACFVATSLFLRDARTPLMGTEGVEFRRKRFVHCTLSLDDVKLVKNAMKCVLAEMMNSNKNNVARWGNLIGYIVLPFRIAMFHDPLEYIRQGKRTVDRKKSSLEAIFTYWSGNLIVKLFGIKALTVHYQSYMNIIKLVLAVDDAQFPDAHQLLDDFAESLRLIRQAASTKS
uniref:Uncharacterized protein n=1 Tax=Oryza sativa subsp. japonica TaxID=39947 RepID=Q6I613_ORYSJ|nr:hypothetical protein [Oryza sativa Japonica Group]